MDVRDTFFKFYPSDWRGDEALQSCSLAARGFWIELMCLAHKWGGVVMIGGKVPSIEALARQTRCSSSEAKKLIDELIEMGVAVRREDDGAIVSKRMVRDALKREIARKNGAKGGSPLLASVNPLVNPQVKRPVNPTDNREVKTGVIPYSYSQKLELDNPHRDADPDPASQPGEPPAWRQSGPRPATLIKPRRNHARCYDAPMACARGLCVPAFLGEQWEAQLGAGQPDTFSASGAVVARINAIIDATPAGTTTANTLDWWRTAWGQQSPRRDERRSDRPIDSLLTFVKRNDHRWFHGSTFDATSGVLTVQSDAHAEYISRHLREQIERAHGGEVRIHAVEH